MTTSAKQVQRFWQARAAEPVAAATVTHRDVWQRHLEIETLRGLVQPTDRVLDIGCGNGYTTRRLAPQVREIVGIDYSDEMIARARREAGPALTFHVHDVLGLGPGDFGLFDVVISVRCLINLAGWAEQQRAIANVASVLKPDGRFLFIEGCRQGRERLNALRATVGLDAMPPVWHNVDFDVDATLAHLERDFVLDRRLHFGVYDFIARVVHPLVVIPETPSYDHRLNEVAAALAGHVDALGDLSRILFLVLRRRPA